METRYALMDLLKIAGDSTRIRILSSLRENELAVNELVEILDMNQSAVSNQLSLLKKSEMVKNRKEGKRIFYSLNTQIRKSPHQSLFEAILDQAASQDQLKNDREKLEEILRRRREESLTQFRNRTNKDKGLPGDSWEATARGFAQLIHNQTIADLGCGSGRLAAILAEGGNQVTGFDNNPEELEEARKWEEEFQGRLRFRECNIEEKQVWDQLYDLVILSHTMHHLTHPSRALKNIGEMLKPGTGKILIFDLAAHEEEIYKEMFGDFWLGFDSELLREWLEDAGLEDVRVKLLTPQEDLSVKPLIATARKKN